MFKNMFNPYEVIFYFGAKSIEGSSSWKLADSVDLLEGKVGSTCEGKRRLKVSNMFKESQSHERELHR